jgi:Arc/MetJ family transcription regulator
MRTNIVIDDTLMQDALAASGLASKRAVVEAGLRSLVSLHRQAGVRRLRGRIKWTGDLAKLRTGRISRR